MFVRPEWPHPLSLIDDVGEDALEEMGKTGFEPTVVVETSLNNFQVWLNHGRVLSRSVSDTLVARQLASRLEEIGGVAIGDTSAGWQGSPTKKRATA